MGEGPDKTFIFALDPAMDMVIGDGSVYDSARVHLAGVTLAGGTHGVRLSDATMCNHSHSGRVAAQVTASTISHLYFANFSGAAVRLSQATASIAALSNRNLTRISWLLPHSPIYPCPLLSCSLLPQT